MLIALDIYLNNNDIKSAKDFIHKSNRIIYEKNKYNTGNYILDALLSDKSNIAEKYNTEILFNGVISVNEIDNIDLCVIFGNAIDNAIEACQQFSLDIRKEINIIIKHLNHFMMIVITNPVVTQLKINNNTIYSTKDDLENHGFGIMSIKRIINKYSGELEINNQNNILLLRYIYP